MGNGDYVYSILQAAKNQGYSEKQLDELEKNLSSKNDTELTYVLAGMSAAPLLSQTSESKNSVFTSMSNKSKSNDLEVMSASKKPQETAIVILETRLKEAQKAFAEQMKKDGWAADVADFIAKLYGSKNTAKKVRADLEAATKQLNQLREAYAQGPEVFKNKFKEIFGVDFDVAKIQAYEKAEESYKEAALHNGVEAYYNETFSTLLKSPELKSEQYYTGGYMGAGGYTTGDNKEQVYEREFNKLAEFLGENGKEILLKALKDAGLENAPMEKKYAKLHEIAKELSNELHKNTLNAGGGKEFSQVQKEYDDAYADAFGTKNDIIKRVTDYNISQDIGAGVVKGIAVAGITLAAALSGGSLAVVAGVAAGSSASAEVTDVITSGEVLGTLKEDGVIAALKKAHEKTDYVGIMENCVVQGGLVLIGGVAAKGIMFVSKGWTTAAKASAMFGTDLAIAAGSEKILTGEITVGGMVFAVALSAAGNIVAMKQIGKAPNHASQASETPAETPSGRKTNSPSARGSANTEMQRITDAINKRVSELKDGESMVFGRKNSSALGSEVNSGQQVKITNQNGEMYIENIGLNPIEVNGTQLKNGAKIKIEGQDCKIKMPGGEVVELKMPETVSPQRAREESRQVENAGSKPTHSRPELDKYKAKHPDSYYGKDNLDFWIENPELFDDLAINNGWAYPKEAPTQQSPWKMHIHSVSDEDWQKMADIIIPYLREHGIAFKTVDPMSGPGSLSGAQSGKAFTIYPKDKAQFEQIARDIDYIIKNNNMQTKGSNIVGDNQLGDSGRIFYRYELKSGKYKDEIIDLTTREGENRYHDLYDANRGENQYLAPDMTVADDPWRNFNPSDPNSKPAHTQASSSVQNSQKLSGASKLEKGKLYEIDKDVQLRLSDEIIDINDPKIKSVLAKMKDGDSITIGRDGDIKINNPYVSSKHLIIHKNNGKFYIEDVSTNGTSVI